MQYYGHRDKLRVIGREDELEQLNRAALRIARKVADDTGTLMAGNICNSNIYTPGDKDIEHSVHKMFKVCYMTTDSLPFIPIQNRVIQHLFSLM